MTRDPLGYNQHAIGTEMSNVTFAQLQDFRYGLLSAMPTSRHDSTGLQCHNGATLSFTYASPCFFGGWKMCRENKSCVCGKWKVSGDACGECASCQAMPAPPPPSPAPAVPNSCCRAIDGSNPFGGGSATRVDCGECCDWLLSLPPALAAALDVITDLPVGITTVAHIECMRLLGCD